MICKVLFWGFRGVLWGVFVFVWFFFFVLVDLLVVWLFGLGVLFWCLLFIFFLMEQCLVFCMLSFTCSCYQAQTRIYFASPSPCLCMYDFKNQVHISFLCLFSRHEIIHYYTISDISFPLQFLIFSYSFFFSNII